MNDWIAVDWGTNTRRAWLISDDGSIRDTAQTDRGRASIAPHDVDAALIDLVGGWLNDDRQTDVIVCGMSDVARGAPCAAFDVATLVSVPSTDARMFVCAMPAIQQMTPPDIMRGEATQISGFVAANPKFDGVVCLIGGHTKWVRISAEEVVSFETYMTGEMISLLSTQSTLRGRVGNGWDQSLFETAVSDAVSKPEKMAARLFTIQASDMDEDAARSRLLGLLIGAEIASARPYWLGQDVVLIGEADRRDAYHAALTAQGAMARAFGDGDTALLGLSYARKAMIDAQK